MDGDPRLFEKDSKQITNWLVNKFAGVEQATHNKTQLELKQSKNII